MKSTFEKTEIVLRNYNDYKKAISNNPKGTVKTQKLVELIDSALLDIKDDPYCKIISLIFFENKTREEVTEYFNNCEVKTVTRNKNRLVNKLKVLIFADESIKELFDYENNNTKTHS